MSDIGELLQEIVKRSRERKLTTSYWRVHGQPAEPFPCMVASPEPSLSEVREMEETLDEMTRRCPGARAIGCGCDDDAGGRTPKAICQPTPTATK
jgi:hypothetical protein